jgi:Tfp pilus assembly protein PilO
MFNIPGVMAQRLHRLSLLLRQGRHVKAPALLIAALALAVLASGLHWGAIHALDQVQAEKDALSQESQELEQELKARRLQGDFVRQLPTSAQTSSVTASIQRQAVAHEVSLSTLSVRSESLTKKTLAHTEWAITLRGTYPNIKSALAELLSLDPSLHIQTLKFTKTSMQEIEAQVSLVQWLGAPIEEQGAK